ncbi:hypothetical protein ACJIZ3_015622 [Penstemon smallii]|uniref:Uncharacterized protein n=1 Tax=Penstemon smallii TaxID=265156 RepID=A0ABD3RN22_9LAMI
MGYQHHASIWMSNPKSLITSTAPETSSEARTLNLTRLACPIPFPPETESKPLHPSY